MVFVFKKGQNFLEELKKKLAEKDITGAFFYGLGGFLEAELAMYDLEKKKYFTKKFKGHYEALGLTGNMASDMIHCHVVLGDKKFRTFGGHLVSAVVAGTLELHLCEEEGLRRVFDEETGLKLLA